MSDTPAPAPLRLLALVAAPLVLRAGGQDQAIAPLNAAGELEAIGDACTLAEPTVAIEIVAEVATTEALNRAHGAIDILHFSGHGSVAGAIATLVLEDTADPGAARLVGATEL